MLVLERQQVIWRCIEMEISSKLFFAVMYALFCFEYAGF